MIRVTLWYEYAQESMDPRREFCYPDMTDEQFEGYCKFIRQSGALVREVYPKGLAGTIQESLEKNPEIKVTSVNMYMHEFGLTDELLESTDVLIWWAHVAHDAVPDELVKKIVARVRKGMGFIALHSAHPSKPLTALLGSSGTLKWREGDMCRVWKVNPTHPIAKGIPDYFELDPEEMYGEPFDIPKPDDLIFMSWFKGGEVFRSGLTWTRGYGKIFYFQPGHETNPTYHNPYVQKIIENAVIWAAPDIWREALSCPHVAESPQSIYSKMKVGTQ